MHLQEKVAFERLLTILEVGKTLGHQSSLREHKPPFLVVWGRDDPSFIAPGA
jgi:hypothetical protein